MLSNWLLEDINENNIFSNLNINKNTPINNNEIKFGAYYGDYTASYSNATYHATNYHAYTDYTAYYNDYTEYSNMYSKQYTAYANYGNYSNACQSTCQVCNTCQTKCQINQYAYTYVGHQMSFSNDLDYIDDTDFNDLIDYINAAAEVCLLTINLNNKKVAQDDIAYTSIFNTINDAIKQFIDGATGYNTKTPLENTILKEELNHFKDVLNQVKIPTTIPCCQTAGYESCISREK